MDDLEDKNPTDPAQCLSAREIVEEARRRARLLNDMPREQLVARFMEIGEEIRQEAIAKGTAIDRDWAVTECGLTKQDCVDP